ncbi:MAG: helix-turn-helix domain-containing protein [Vicinamibacteraceae bacterium]
MRRRILNAGAVHSPRFYNVSQVADLLGVSPMTVYREIQVGKFPAVQMRGRYLIPAKAIDDMEAAALAEQTVVSAADFVPQNEGAA